MTKNLTNLQLKTQWRRYIYNSDRCGGSGAFLTPGSGMGKKSGSGSGMNNPDYISESLETIFWVKILKVL
jgi:hypothetical protein